MAASIPPDARDLFDATTFAHVATVNDDGSPQTTPVWVERDGDDVLLNTAQGRLKHRNLVRDPRVALSITDPHDGYRYIQVRGRAQLTDDPDAAHISRLSRKYLGRDYPFLQPGEQRVTIRIRPESVDYHKPRR